MNIRSTIGSVLKHCPLTEKIRIRFSKMQGKAQPFLELVS